MLDSTGLVYTPQPPLPTLLVTFEKSSSPACPSLPVLRVKKSFERIAEAASSPEACRNFDQPFRIPIRTNPTPQAPLPPRPPFAFEPSSSPAFPSRFPCFA
ncbi:hypothetical protein KFK09_024152 [Dendrobium nobile]|uniref:Uncharacterized protein n=1 Tax=Dendrobium nobile TaxID=94219 RepID=A0A8T3AD76_DENNO|nr:hypothetical protein KFK09_024152 [Dendrobium nobile]